MVIVPESYTFVATPRTGSRSISEAILAERDGAISDYPRNHHVLPESVPRDYHVYTVIRHPVAQLYSWYYHVVKRNGGKLPFSRFIREYNNPQFLDRDTKYPLNMYAEVATYWYVFENGLDGCREGLGLTKPLPKTGTQLGKKLKKPQRVPLTMDDAVYIYEEFAADLELYERIRNEQSNRNGWKKVML